MPTTTLWMDAQMTGRRPGSCVHSCMFATPAGARVFLVDAAACRLPSLDSRASGCRPAHTTRRIHRTKVAWLSSSPLLAMPSARPRADFSVCSERENVNTTGSRPIAPPGEEYEVLGAIEVRGVRRDAAQTWMYYWVQSFLFSSTSSSSFSTPTRIVSEADDRIRLEFCEAGYNNSCKLGGAGNPGSILFEITSANESGSKVSAEDEDTVHVIKLSRWCNPMVTNAVGIPIQKLPGERTLLRKFIRDASANFDQKLSILQRPAGVRLGRQVLNALSMNVEKPKKELLVISEAESAEQMRLAISTTLTSSIFSGAGPSLFQSGNFSTCLTDDGVRVDLRGAAGSKGSIFFEVRPVATVKQDRLSKQEVEIWVTASHDSVAKTRTYRSLLQRVRMLASEPKKRRIN
ncbi:hypothetical protein FVE85_7434 [Porphyridium purpureum]|uniref:Uncharacterized protein n=1 Tax=Porphyridium purpureum TaxID=35688 RepID=A0A5J4Z749_PORPP|nr:hypothetical protein FVE85_7434 [Porphyridium purpureum]|eukprot:POR2989..scf295_1